MLHIMTRTDNFPSSGGYYDFEIYSVNSDYNGTEFANLTGIRTAEDGKVELFSCRVTKPMNELNI